MIAITFSRGLVLASAVLAMNTMAASHAAGEMKASDMMKLPMMDKDKDGMVSKAEFIEMAGKVFDMKAKEMKAKDNKLDAGQLDALRRAMFEQ